ncbi:hypothetical protein HFO65_29175 [Rhizobium laguerreae]|uniref:hypothetical protein n=1 Tax=Rhizobium laguerreae TaxID=1076926 RepID=UPI001441DED6|nr:hypothetical protein [Rhizobium laguerreae]MBY3141835.1 hypothetical protein [Rhizobium laguerreae]MBY3164674.1 hypothetical protein [Rhizobium laguerreae]MBY3205163.1 hypothetical protein [Rhizobium laguerreae]MBY3266691.1 hypothetical protein [Rhizobium laguerreae]MBY3341944.1 hypothetical protein [Rhizobium laguerreae]
MSNAHPFQVGSQISLHEDWTFTVENNRISSRIWDAADCGSDPEYVAANARWQDLIAEKHAILERGAGPRGPVQLPTDDGGWTTKILAKEPGPGDKKRMKVLDQELDALWQPMFRSKVTLPAGTVMEIALITPLPDFDAGVVRFNVTSTTHSGLQTKKEGGTLSNGKRVFLIHGHQFRHAKYQAVKP